MEINRRYLTSQEIKTIGDMVLEMDNYMDREWLKVLMVADFCTDFKIKENEDGSKTWSENYYNELLENECVESIYNGVMNIYDIDAYVKDKESVYNLLKGFIDNINNSISNIDTDKLLLDFSGAINQLKEVK